MYSLGTMNRNNNLILSMQKIEGRCRHPVVPTRSVLLLFRCCVTRGIIVH